MGQEGERKLEMVPANDPILRTVMPRFDFDDPPEDPQKLAEELYLKMMQEDGLGLAAKVRKAKKK